jgi:hypothetical protein
MRSWILLLALAAPAAADETIPSVKDPAAVDGVPQNGPLDYHAVASISREHSCSQSFEESSFQAKLALAVDAAGNAALTLESTDSYIFGPAMGQRRPGEQNSRRSTENKLAWRGTAKRTGDQLLLELHADGGAPFRISCRVTPLDVGKDWRQPQLPEKTKVLMCSGAETLVGSHFDLSVGDQLAFGRGAGFQVSMYRMDVMPRGGVPPNFSRAN